MSFRTSVRNLSGAPRRACLVILPDLHSIISAIASTKPAHRFRLLVRRRLATTDLDIRPPQEMLVCTDVRLVPQGNWDEFCHGIFSKAFHRIERDSRASRSRNCEIVPASAKKILVPQLGP